MKNNQSIFSISIFIYLLFFSGISINKDKEEFLGLTDLVVSQNDHLLYLAEHDASKIDVFDLKSMTVKNSVMLNDKPVKISISGNNLLVIAGEESGKLLIYNRLNPQKPITISVGHSPCDLVETTEYYIICNRFPGELTIIDKRDQKLIKKLKVGREPISLAYLPSKNQLFVAHHLPEMSVQESVVASKITLIDLSKLEISSQILLPNGSNGVKKIKLSADGKHAFITHLIGRFYLPTTQLERGWMNTNALSILDTEKSALWKTILLDDVDRGAANPWAIACLENGSEIFISHAGTNELSAINWEKMKLSLIEEDINQPKNKLTESLGYIYQFRTRLSLQGIGPRSIVVSGNQLVTANYFSNNLNIIDLQTKKLQNFQLVNAGLSKIKRGEAYFNDAGLCFQNWQSCASCHPDARVDGLNWDLLNDGVGNPKNTRSMLLSHATPPVMSLGVRSHAKIAVRAGFKFIQFADVPEEYSADVDAYLESLKPVSNPLKYSKTECEPGEKIFTTMECVKCHPAPYFTDLKSYNFGNDTLKWDTPTLVEIWRTAPFWHDGKYTTLKELFEVEKHGIHGTLSDKEASDLEKYLLNL
jgi:hypothetical protein